MKVGVPRLVFFVLMVLLFLSLSSLSRLLALYWGRGKAANQRLVCVSCILNVHHAGTISVPCVVLSRVCPLRLSRAFLGRFWAARVLWT